MAVRDKVETRPCDECETDTTHDVEYSPLASDLTIEVTECRSCGLKDSNTYTEGEDR